MKTDKNFKLSKPSKTMLALFPHRDKQDRGAFKRRMIDGEASLAIAKITRSREKEKS
jgi:hypothetical protein